MELAWIRYVGFGTSTDRGTRISRILRTEVRGSPRVPQKPLRAWGKSCAQSRRAIRPPPLGSNEPDRRATRHRKSAPGREACGLPPSSSIRFQPRRPKIPPGQRGHVETSEQDEAHRRRRRGVLRDLLHPRHSQSPTSRTTHPRNSKATWHRTLRCPPSQSLEFL